MIPEKNSIPGPSTVARETLDNGITLLVRENFTSPAVVVGGYIPGGAMLEAREKAGLASFYASMLTRGSEHHSYEELFDLVEGLGASLDVGASRHILDFGVKCLSEDLPVMLSLLSETVQHPLFLPDEMEKIRTPLLTGLKMREESTRHMASLAYAEALYRDHPYARSINGYLDTVPAISREDLFSYHRRIGPRGTVIALSGAISQAEAIRLLRTYFGDWENPQQASSISIPSVELHTKITDKRIGIPGKSQSDLILGYVGPSRLSEDFQAARLADSILGVFGMYGRLGERVRRKEGLAYYAYSHLGAGLGPSPWGVSAGVAPEKVDQAIQLILGEIKRMNDELVSEDELEDNKSFFKGHLVLGLETNEGVVASLLAIEQYQLGLDYFIHYNEFVDRVTVIDVQSVSRKYLNPEIYTVAVAGPRS